MVCDNCGTTNRLGAAFCDNCGNSLTGPGNPPGGGGPATNGAALKCHACGSLARTGARWCDNCGTRLDLPPVHTELAATLAGPSDSSPEGRRAFLEDHDGRSGPPPVGDWIERIADAERFAEQCEADLDEARDQLSYARHAIRSEHLDQRDLDPETRHRYVEYQQAEERWRRRAEVAERAQARLNRLVGDFDEATKLPGPLLDAW